MFPPAPCRRLTGHAVVQELRQHGVEVFAGADQGVVDAVAGAAAADLLQVRPQRRQVALAQRPRIAEELLELFQALEPRRAGEGKIQLVVVQTWNTSTSCPRWRSSFSPRNSPLAVDQQVGDQHHHAAAGIGLGHRAAGSSQVGLVARAG